MTPRAASGTPLPEDHEDAACGRAPELAAGNEMKEMRAGMSRCAKGVGATAGALLLVAGLSGCTGSTSGPTATKAGESSSTSQASKKPSSTTKPSSATKPSSSSSKAGSAGTADVDKPESMGSHWAGIAKDVKLGDCGLKKGEVAAHGEVTNSAKSARDVQVTVLWIDQKTGATYGSKSFSRKSLEPGSSTDFTLKATIPQNANKCAIQARSAAVGTLK